MAVDVQLVLDPEWTGPEERANAARRNTEIGFENALELEQGLVVEPDVVEIASCNLSLAQAEVDGVTREAGIALHAREALLLHGGDDFAVAHEARRTVVVEGGNPQDVHISHRCVRLSCPVSEESDHPRQEEWIGARRILVHVQPSNAVARRAGDVSPRGR